MIFLPLSISLVLYPLLLLPSSALLSGGAVRHELLSVHPAVQRSEELNELIHLAGYDETDDEPVVVESLSSETSYCNSVFLVRRGGHNGHNRRCSSINKSDNGDAIAVKLFSKLARTRMDPSRMIGVVEDLVAQEGLGPRLLAATANGIVTEFCNGRPLTEADLHQRDAIQECQLVAKALARLHSMNPQNIEQQQEQGRDNNNNMLWRACSTMLDMASPDWCGTTGSSGHVWTLRRIRQEVEHHKRQLAQRKLPIVTVGHGDLKPSNVLLLTDDSNNIIVQFIDLELAGTHFRAFDLAKFFRTENGTYYTEVNRQAFYESYYTTTKSMGTTKSVVPVLSVDALHDEAKTLLPLTWLEAAIFFVCMECQDSPAHDRWSQLALDRLQSYERSML